MAQLKDSIVSGNLRVTDTTLTDTIQVTTIKAPTSSVGTTYGPGTSGQVLTTNGTLTYWGAANNHTHSYLPLSGGTISNSSFGPLTIERTGSVNAAAIYFKNTNGVLGAIGMTNNVDSGLYRWTANTSSTYRILDAENYTSYTYSSTASRTANTVLAAPNGSDGVATFRALVAADLPDTYIPTSIIDITNTSDIGLDVTRNGFGYVNNVTKADWNYQQKDGVLIRQVYSNLWKLELYGDYRTGHLSVRGKNNGTWQNWLRILDEGNYTTFALPATTTYAGSPSVGGAANYVYIPRSSSNANSLPGQYKVNFVEYTNSSTNIPSSYFYHIMSAQGEDTRYGTQLALGMTTDGVYYRNYNNQTWGSWQPLGRFISTPTTGQVVVTDGTTGGIKTTGYTIATSVPSGAVFTDTKVTSSANHYTPSTASGSDKTASASGATAAWSIDVVKGVTLNTDGKGHVTGISVTSGKIPANPNTDTKVTQSETTATNYRPVVLGYKYGAATDNLTGTVTDQVYVSNNCLFQPQTGKLLAQEFRLLNWERADVSDVPRASATIKYVKDDTKDDNYASLAFSMFYDRSGTKYSNTFDAIRFHADRSGDAGKPEGGILSISGRGLTMIGGGEAPHALAKQISVDQSAAGATKLILCGDSMTANNERLILSSDSHIYFVTNADEIANRKAVKLSNTLEFYPDANSTGSLGTSSYKWSSVYATTVMASNVEAQDIYLLGLNSKKVNLVADITVNTDQYATFPNKSGIVAFTSDIPSISANQQYSPQAGAVNIGSVTINTSTYNFVVPKATSSQFGAVKVSDAYSTSDGSASSSIAASSYAVNQVYQIADTTRNLTINGKSLNTNTGSVRVVSPQAIAVRSSSNATYWRRVADLEISIAQGSFSATFLIRTAFHNDTSSSGKLEAGIFIIHCRTANTVGTINEAATKLCYLTKSSSLTASNYVLLAHANKKSGGQDTTGGVAANGIALFELWIKGVGNNGSHIITLLEESSRVAVNTEHWKLYNSENGEGVSSLPSSTYSTAAASF